MFQCKLHPAAPLGPWRVLVADDCDDMHAITRLALKGFSYEGRSLEMLSAYSAAETISMLIKNPDVAMLFLDVVMEHDRAGLEAIHRIRHELLRHDLRIVVRTGQPGFASEINAFRHYDIHDYIRKSEMSPARLKSITQSCLRAYQGFVSL